MTVEALTVYEPPEQEDVLWNPERYRHALELAGTFAASQLIPPHLRGNVPDVLIALTMAKRLREDPLIVLQSIYVVQGRAGWAAQYMIARANSSGKFKGGIRWREEGSGEGLVVIAYAQLAETGETIEQPVSFAMAKAEGWVQRNPKYRSMPQLMLRYRSATLLVRLYCPEVMLGMHTIEEIRDGDDGPEDPPPTKPVALVLEASPLDEPPRGVAAVAAVVGATRPPESAAAPAPAPAEPAPAEPPPPSSSSQVAAADPNQPERDRLIAELKELGTKLPEATTRELRQVHGLMKISPTKADVGKLRRLVEDARKEVSRLASLAEYEKANAVWKDPGTPTGEELLSELLDLQIDLENDQGQDVVVDAATVAGLEISDGGPVVDGVEEPMLRRFLAEMKDRVLL